MIIYIIAGFTTLYYGLHWLTMASFAVSVNLGGSEGFLLANLASVVSGFLAMLLLRRSPLRAFKWFLAAAGGAAYVALLPFTGSGYSWPVWTYGTCAFLTWLVHESAADKNKELGA